MTPTNKALYLNKPQLKSSLIQANEEYHILGRGTGKTSRILAHRSLHNMKIMPGSSGFNVAESYQQQLTRTLPSLVAGWQAFGFIRDVHYVIGKQPDAKLQRLWNWKPPLEPPVDYNRYIACCYGSGIHMISQDVVGGSLGLNTDWGMGDEVKNLDYQQFSEETVPTMRSNMQYFGHLAEHLSLVFTTSMPGRGAANWLEEKKKEMDEDLVNCILMARLFLDEKKRQLIITPEDDELIKLIQVVERNLNDLRKDCVFYQEASTLENIHALGIDYVKKMKRVLPPLLFEIEILNIKPGTIEGGYYPSFDLGVHVCKPSYNNTYLESFNYDLDALEHIDCRQDADLNLSLPIRIAVDWGGHMNYMSIAQEQGIYYKFINELYVKNPEGLEHLAVKFANYYKYHRTKKLEFLYDHTGNTVQATGRTNADDFIKALKNVDDSWEVVKLSEGAAPGHDDKFKMIFRALLNLKANLRRIIIVDTKCKYLIGSIQNAPLKEKFDKGITQIVKDKSSERKFLTIDPLDATHASDTFDIHIGSRFRSLIEDDNYYVGI